MKILAIDPGTDVSGAVLYDADARRVIRAFPEVENSELRWWIASTRDQRDQFDQAAIEMIACYGMRVGREVFDTCVWIGRFVELIGERRTNLVFRRDVKRVLCNSVTAQDGAVRAALLDRFGGRKAAVGTKKHQGPLYGVSKHAWAALGVALYVEETK